MTSFPVRDQEDSLFLLNEHRISYSKPSEVLNGIKSFQSILSGSSSSTSTTLPNQQQQQAYRSTSARPLTPPLRLSSDQSSNDVNTFVHQFERRLDEHRVLWQKDYDRKIQRMIESKNSELEGLKLRYEKRLNDFEENNKQLEIVLGQISEENKRLKIEIEYEKQQNKLEQLSVHKHSKEFESDVERKIHDMKSLHETEKQDVKRQQSRIYQDLLDETNQRLKKMENDYKYQQSTNESMVDEMEKRMVDLRSNVEHLQQMKQKFEEEKIHFNRNNEQLKLQVQELTNKLRHIDRDHADKLQRYENEIKSVRLHSESDVDFLRKETDITKSKANKTIDHLEKNLSSITEKFNDMQKLFEKKLNEQQTIYHNNTKQCEHDYEKRIQILKQELKEHKDKIYLSSQHNEQIQNELKEHKDLIEKNERIFKEVKINLENKIQEINNKTYENEQKLIEKLQFEYEQAKQQCEEKLRTNFLREIEEIKHEYEQIIEKKEEKMKSDLQKIDKLSVETKIIHENEKQQLVNGYEQFVRKLEKQYLLKNNEYEKRTETLIANTHEQFKSMEDDFQVRHSKQQSLVNDQQKMIQVLKDELNTAKIFYEKQCGVLSERSVEEKNEIKAQFDSCIKNFEKNVHTLTLKKEQLERKLSYLNEQHKNEMIEYRLSYEKNIKGLLSNDVRNDLENTIHSLKQQVVYLQQRIAFIQQELEQYVQIYGHRPSSQ